MTIMVRADCAKFADGRCDGSHCTFCQNYVKADGGMKFDNGKTRWELLPWDEAEDVVRVLMFGSQKYEDFNWQRVNNGRARYFDAAIRHLLAWKRGEKLDPDSGLPHLSHLGCCMLFLAWFDKHENELSAIVKEPIAESGDNSNSDNKEVE